MVYARHVDLSDEAVKHDHMVREIYPPFYAMFDPVKEIPLSKRFVVHQYSFHGIDQCTAVTKTIHAP